LAEGKDLAVIGYHVNDDYTNVYGDARVAYYGMVGLPHVVIDGSQFFEWGYDDILAGYEDRIVVNTNGTFVNANINVGFIGAPNPETKVLHLVLTESHIYHPWYGGDELNHVERMMIPDQNGTSIVSESFDFDFEMDPAWLAQYCELVAFVQDTVTREVMQAQVFHLEETILYNDVVLAEIISPGDNYCNNEISPEIKIVNFGADTLKSCVISYSINNEAYEYNWQGNLSTYQKEHVVLPEVNIDLENDNSIEVVLSFPNGQEDEYPDNNLLNKDFEISQVLDLLPLQFEIRTDNFGSETSWELKNSAEEVLYSGSEYENNTLYAYEWDLSTDDCYTFIVYDSAGNGICCESGFGFYKIKDSTGETIFNGGNFDFQEISTFQIDIGTDVLDLAESNELLVYPNPANDFLFIEANEFIFEIIITDLRGEAVFEKSNLANNNYTIDLNKMPMGIYVIRIQLEHDFQYHKIIIK